jgi:predicted RNA binding protein YcfA (HicA-like mRNA interferase family)
MTAKEVLKKLKAAGWSFREGRKHTTAISPDGTRTTRVWRHTGDIPAGTLAAIEKQSGMKF